MPTFALITEGITDQAALESILAGHYYSQGDDIEVNPLQPLRDETDRSRQPEDAFGGWELVLEYCASQERLREALVWNDFLVIQIDTDCCDHPNYNVPLTIGGAARPIPELVNAVKEKIVGILGDELYQAYREKVLFAICVHSLECWLIPLHETAARNKRKTNNCSHHLGRVLGRLGKASTKDYDTYSELSRGYRRNGVVDRNTKFNESFAIFVGGLPTLEPAEV